MKKSIIIASIVIILALIGGGVFWYFKQSNKPINPSVTENENQPSENPKSEIINTDDWLTYRNEEYGFELKYPKEWIIEDNKNMFLFQTEERQKQLDKNLMVPISNFSIFVARSISELPSSQKYYNMDKIGLEQWINKEIDEQYLSDKRIVKINNINGYRVSTGIYTEGFFFDSIYVEHNYKIYVFNILDLKLKEIDRIINSFKFIN